MTPLLTMLIVGIAAFFAWRLLRPRPATPHIELRATLHQDPHGLTAISAAGGPEYSVDIVGESHHQEALADIAGGYTTDGARVQATATLVLESKNRYDPEAVAIHINSKKVGHLSRENARRYRARLSELGTPDREATCPAIIVGGWKRRNGNTGHFGVKLDLTGI